jgi:hypothetical protein
MDDLLGGYMEVIDVTECGVVVGDAGDAVANHGILQAIMDSLRQPNNYTVVQLPPGPIKIHGTINYQLDEDAPVRVIIRGAGRDVTDLHQTNGYLPLFHVGTSVNHINRFGMEDLSCFHGGLQLTRVGGESWLDNIQIAHCHYDPAALLIEDGCTNLQIRNLSILHSGGTASNPDSQAIVIRPNTAVMFQNFRSGEDCGGITINGGSHYFLGCDFEAGRKIGSYAGMGQALFDVGIQARLRVANSNIAVTSGRRLSNLYWADEVDFSGCLIQYDTTNAIAVNTHLAANRKCRVRLVGNTFDNLTAGGSLRSGEPDVGWLVMGNRWLNPISINLGQTSSVWPT